MRQAIFKTKLAQNTVERRGRFKPTQTNALLIARKITSRTFIARSIPALVYSIPATSRNPVYPRPLLKRHIRRCPPFFVIFRCHFPRFARWLQLILVSLLKGASMILTRVLLAFFCIDKIKIRPAHRQLLLQEIGDPFFR